MAKSDSKLSSIFDLGNGRKLDINKINDIAYRHALITGLRTILDDPDSWPSVKEHIKANLEL